MGLRGGGGSRSHFTDNKTVFANFTENEMKRAPITCRPKRDLVDDLVKFACLLIVVEIKDVIQMMAKITMLTIATFVQEQTY